MKIKLKTFLAFFISAMPFNFLRCFFYRLLFNYTILDSYIGFLAIINIEKLYIDRAKIGKFNYFIGPLSVQIGVGTQVGFRNKFNCGSWVKKKRDYQRTLVIDSEVLITNGHHFDVAGSIFIGKRSVIAGINSQFWTHGNGVTDRDIHIDQSCYIGTSCIFCPGSEISEGTTVGAGTVVTRKFKKPGVLIVGTAGREKEARN